MSDSDDLVGLVNDTTTCNMQKRAGFLDHIILHKNYKRNKTLTITQSPNATFLASYLTPMKVNIELPTGKNTQRITPKIVFLVTASLFLLTIVPLYLSNNYPSPLQSPRIKIHNSTTIELVEKCDIFNGRWVPYPKEPYYTNATCPEIINQQNCMKFGRPDTEFLKWRWRPDECELPVFDAGQFLEIVRGKSMGFVGDSVGRNQMQSLVCLLDSVVHPVDISNEYTNDTNFKRWFYTDYNFTLATFWAPFLVKARDSDPKGHHFSNLMNLYLDEADEAWPVQIENFDYVIISAGQWFFRPLMLYKNAQVVGCQNCQIQNITSVPMFYGYRMAFRAAFKAILNLKNYKGLTILRTFSPAHFENGEWNKGGNCVRTKPFTNEEMKLDGYNLEFYLTQVDEFKAAQREGRMKGLKFRLLKTTEAMLLRPDGHPNHYGHSPHKNVTIADCVHWCLPGPIDTWNEFLLEILKAEGERLFTERLQTNSG